MLNIITDYYGGLNKVQLQRLVSEIMLPGGGKSGVQK